MLERLARRSPDLKAALVAPARFAAWCVERGVALLSPPADATEPALLGRWADALFERAPRDLALIVDVFPRGVLGELRGVLPRLERPPWLVSRRVRADYYLEPSVRDALESRYRGLLWCEEPPPGLDALGLPQRRVPPVVICRPDECLSREDARRELGLEPDGRVLLLLGAGDRIEQEERLALLTRVALRLEPRPQLVGLSAVLRPERAPGRLVRDAFPAMRLLRAADVVVAGGGYASFHETRALGVPALYLPQPRRYDDQRWRVATAPPLPDSPEELERAIREALEGPATRRPAAEGDGADAIAAHVLGEGSR